MPPGLTRPSSLASTSSTACSTPPSGAVMLRPIPIGSMTDADLEPGRSGVGAAEAKEAKEDEGMPSDQITLEDGIHFVHWDGPNDLENPKNWTRRRKWVLSLSGTLFCALVSMAVSGYSISQESVVSELRVSRELAVVGVTLFTLMFGAAPLIFAPLSEVYGRNGLYLISAILFTLFFIPQALAKNIQTILISRFFAGAFGSSAVALVGGTLADIWDTKDRGLPMALFSYAAFASTGFGPVVFGIMEERYHFRIVEWTLLACSGAFTILLVFILKESRASVILSRKAARMRKETGNDQIHSRDDFERGSFLMMMKTSLTRPVRMLCTEPVLVAFTVYISFAWMVLYILLQSISLVFGGIYSFSIGKSGYVFSTQVIGATVGLGLDQYFNKVYDRNVGRIGAEARLYTAMSGGVMMPVGAWIYAWTARESIHWVVPCIGISILYCGMYLAYLATFSYLADSYTLYASSALSAQSFIRNLLGCVAPLYTNQLYHNLGIAGGGSLVAGIATLLAVLPFLLYRYGARLRARSKFVQDLKARQGEDDR